MLGETKQGSPFIGGGRAVRAPILYSYVCFRLFSAIFVVSFLYSYLPFPPFLFFVIMLWVSLCGRGFLFLCFVVNALRLASPFPLLSFWLAVAPSLCCLRLS